MFVVPKGTKGLPEGTAIGKKCSRPVSLQDIYPTLIRVASLSWPHSMTVRYQQLSLPSRPQPAILLGHPVHPSVYPQSFSSEDCNSILPWWLRTIMLLSHNPKPAPSPNSFRGTGCWNNLGRVVSSMPLPVLLTVISTHGRRRSSSNLLRIITEPDLG